MKESEAEEAMTTKGARVSAGEAMNASKAYAAAMRSVREAYEAAMRAAQRALVAGGAT